MWMTRLGAAVALAIALAACSTVVDREHAATDARTSEVQPMPRAPEPVREVVASPDPPPVIAAKPAPRPVAASKPKPQSKPESLPEAKPEPVVQAKPEPRPVAVNSISGRVELDAAPGQRVAAGEVAQAVVYFLPRSGGARPKPGRFSVDTHSKGFRPALSVVPVGSTVSFPNRDVILHNVFSNTPGATFDLGTYGPGETRSNRFTKAGLVSVNCNVHNGMRANVLVLSTSYYTRPRADGRFVLDDLPPGPGTLVFWHPRARAQSQGISGPMKQPVTGQLVASRPSLDSHVH